MLLSITTTTAPATDLGYLLHKHPERVQAFDLAFGQAHVFYPEASEDRCAAALLLDVDPVGLVRQHRGPAGEGQRMEQYVNDRPYVASSLMSVAIARVLGSALGALRLRFRQPLLVRHLGRDAQRPVVPRLFAGGGAVLQPLRHDLLGALAPRIPRRHRGLLRLRHLGRGHHLAGGHLGPALAGSGLVDRLPHRPILRPHRGPLGFADPHARLALPPGMQEIAGDMARTQGRINEQNRAITDIGNRLATDQAIEQGDAQVLRSGRSTGVSGAVDRRVIPGGMQPFQGEIAQERRRRVMQAPTGVRIGETERAPMRPEDRAVRQAIDQARADEGGAELSARQVMATPEVAQAQEAATAAGSGRHGVPSLESARIGLGPVTPRR